MTVYGYARVSTEDQNLDQQAAALRAHGCDVVVEERVSGAAAVRPNLDRLLAALRPGDRLVVLRLDRLARSLARFTAIMEAVAAKGAQFASIDDRIDTADRHASLLSGILATVAEYERALIRQRTLEGLARPKAEGRCGNPGLKARDPAALARIARGRTVARLARLEAREEEWLPTVRALRPQTPWDRVALALARRRPGLAATWTAKRLRAATAAYVSAGRLDSALLGRAPRRDRAGFGESLGAALPRRQGASSPRAAAIAAVAVWRRAEPRLTVRDIARRLDREGVPTPGRSDRWAPSTVALYLREAEAGGLWLRGGGAGSPAEKGSCAPHSPRGKGG